MELNNLDRIARISRSSGICFTGSKEMERLKANQQMLLLPPPVKLPPPPPTPTIPTRVIPPVWTPLPPLPPRRSSNDKRKRTKLNILNRFLFAILP